MGWGVRGGCSLWGHSASGARPLLQHQWEESMLCICPVPDLQGAPPEGCYPGPACESPAWPWLPGAGLRQDLPLHIQDLHWYLKAHRAALPEVQTLFGTTICLLLSMRLKRVIPLSYLCSKHKDWKKVEISSLALFVGNKICLLAHLKTHSLFVCTISEK